MAGINTNYPFAYFLQIAHPFLTCNSYDTRMSQALSGKKQKEAEAFYNGLLKVMNQKKLPFMIAGTFAFSEYTGIERPTGDIDIMIPYEDHPTVLKTLTDAGYKPELAEIDLKWLAKVYDEKGYYTDLIWAERNGLHKIERSWLKKAKPATILGHNVLLEPVEEMIRSKCYIMNRHRNDSGDVIHLILRQGKNVDWEELLLKMDPHWELLLSNILLFLFVYPSERENIPKWVIERLVVKLEDRISHPPTKNKITRGLLLSSDYQIGVSQWGFQPITELK